MKLPDKPGETIYFPVVQTCESGEVAWIEIPEEGADEPEHPAPGITLTAAVADGSDEYAEPSGDVVVSTSDDGPSSGVVWAAFAFGLVGMVAGGGGLFAALRKK